MKNIKITYIGGGSRYWAQNLMSDLAQTSKLSGELFLYDIDQEAADKNSVIGKEIFSHPESKTTFSVTAERDLDTALKGADFVIMSIEPGPIEMRYADLEIPRKYGILQAVGDTIGPGGILRALRSVSIYTDYAHKIMELCPDAWVINYTNPMTLCTSALFAAEPDIKAFGCCHEVMEARMSLAELVGEKLEIEKPSYREIELDLTGVNHFTFALSARWKGKDLFPYIKEMIGAPGFWDSRESSALERIKEEEWFDNDARIALDYFRNFGALGVAGDRHLAEFVPWYLGSEKDLNHYGVVSTPYEWRLKNDIEKKKEEFSGKLSPSGEEGVEMILALAGEGDLVSNVNVPNRGQVPDLPLGAIVETNGRLTNDKLETIDASPMPAGLKSLVQKIVNVQKLTLEGCMKEDKQLILEALLNDPLVTIRPDKAKEMMEEMVSHVREYIPWWE